MDLKETFKEYRSIIQNLIPSADIQHVGGSAIPGAITKGDLDIQIRVKLEEMTDAINKLDSLYARKHEELWKKNFAIFKDDKPDLKVDIMLNVIDSAFDTFFRVRDLLIADKDLLEEYNTLKQSYSSQPYEIQSKQKRAFFDRLYETHLDLES
jgi:GrpB-like predicted nucleotidyltransferase (UPF0157 family)